MDFPIILEGKTYDIKQFLHDHPGGVNTIKNYKGKSVLQAMAKFEHSVNAYHLLNDFEVVEQKFEDVNLTGGVSANGRVLTTEETKRNLDEIKFLEELENRLDWSKALLPQLHLIGPHYNLWVHIAVYRKCRLFTNPLMESMTFTPWYLVPMIWVPTILYLGCQAFIEFVACGDSCQGDPMTTPRFIYHLLLGVMIWTSLEYILHRWVFHLDPGNNLTMMKIHFLIHGLHHKMPFDGLRQAFPPLPAALITCFIYGIMSQIVAYPPIKLVGGLVGYLTYDMIHVYAHRGSPQDGSYLYNMKRYHSNHHFLNHDKAFGVSTNIWDYVFKTFVKVKKLGFSLHW